MFFCVPSRRITSKPQEKQAIRNDNVVPAAALQELFFAQARAESGHHILSLNKGLDFHFKTDTNTKVLKDSVVGTLLADHLDATIVDQSTIMSTHFEVCRWFWQLQKDSHVRWLCPFSAWNLQRKLTAVVRSGKFIDRSSGMGDCLNSSKPWKRFFWLEIRIDPGWKIGMYGSFRVFPNNSNSLGTHLIILYTLFVAYVADQNQATVGWMCWQIHFTDWVATFY